jgi:methionyl-tRNA synthetase
MQIRPGWEESGKDQLKDGHELNKAEIIFRKIEDSEVEKQINKLSVSEELPAEDEKISIDDFTKVHLKTAKVLYAEKVPKSNKLLKLKVKIGEEERQIIAGVAEAYKPEELTGRTIVIVANLKPAKLMGMESNGMLLAAHSQNGLKVLFLDDNVEAGVRIK